MKRITQNQMVAITGGNVPEIVSTACSMVSLTGAFAGTKIGAKLLLKAGLRMIPSAGWAMFGAGLACDIFF